MRISIASISLALAILAAAPAARAGWYVYEHNTHDALDWHNAEGQVLKLDSSQGHGIDVTQVVPANLWGLRKGDVIVSVNGHAVKHVDELFAQLKNNTSTAVQLRVQRATGEHGLTLPANDYMHILRPRP